MFENIKLSARDFTKLHAIARSQVRVQGSFDPVQRADLLATLDEQTVQIDVIRDLSGFPDADEFDVLNSIGFDGEVFRRAERAEDHVARRKAGGEVHSCLVA